MMIDDVTWEHFRDSARIDRIAWKVLLAIEMNGLAAYHMQQSAEKYLKAVIMKYELIDSSPKELGHTPYVKLLGDIEEMAVKNRYGIPEYAIRDLFKCLYDFSGNLTDEKRNFFWKQSLGLESTEHEIKKFQEPAHLKRQKFIETYQSNFPKDPMEYSKNREFRSEYTSDLKQNAKLLISSSLDTFMLVTPHMEIGRYPTMIDGILSTDVYKENSKVLRLAVMVDPFSGDVEYILSQPG